MVLRRIYPIVSHFSWWCTLPTTKEQQLTGHKSSPRVIFNHNNLNCKSWKRKWEYLFYFFFGFVHNKLFYTKNENQNSAQHPHGSNKQIYRQRSNGSHFWESLRGWFCTGPTNFVFFISFSNLLSLICCCWRFLQRDGRAEASSFNVTAVYFEYSLPDEQCGRTKRRWWVVLLWSSLILYADHIITSHSSTFFCWGCYWRRW